MRFITSVLMLLLLLTGCTAEQEQLVPNGEEKPTSLTLTPVDMFKGDGEKFRLFLGDMSGAFKLRYEGIKPNAHLDIDIWNGGKKVASAGSVGDLFFSTDKQVSGEIEVMISIDTISIEGQDDLSEIKVGIVNDTGTGLHTFTSKWDDQLTSRGLLQDNTQRTFSTDESVYVWGVQATRTDTIRAADLSPESLSRLEWAIVFNLRFED